jgi:hypothetical protein
LQVSSSLSSPLLRFELDYLDQIKELTAVPTAVPVPMRINALTMSREEFYLLSSVMSFDAVQSLCVYILKHRSCTLLVVQFQSYSHSSGCYPIQPTP